MLRFISMIFVLGLSWSSPLAARAGTDAVWLKGLPLDKAIRIGSGTGDSE